jgi:hypothetical protein
MGVVVLWICVLVYVASAIVTAVVVFLASKWVGDELRPATHRVSLSVAAGVVWPLLLLGVFELSSYVLYTKMERRVERRFAIVA